MIAGEVPDAAQAQLLRSFGKPAQEPGGDAHQRCPRLLEMGRQANQRDRRLTRMFGSAPLRGHQPGPAGNRLVASFWIGQSNEETPPVAHQRHSARSEAVQVMGQF